MTDTTQNTQLAKAIAIASVAFQDKLDKGGQPYILHCLRVMGNVNQNSPKLMQVAILHDLLEDCPDWSVERLQDEGFDNVVCKLITMLSRSESESYKDYIDRIQCNPLATEVKIADLRDNTNITRLKGLRPQDFERLEKYHRAYTQLINA